MTITVPIAPHKLTPEALPEKGRVIGYTGLAFFGDDFSEHGPISGPLVVGERTDGFAPGFYAATPEGYEVFVLFGDDEIRQLLHGYVL